MSFDGLTAPNITLDFGSIHTIFTAPAPDAKSVIDLPPGSEVRILRDSGPWRYVEIPGDLRGWIRAEALEPVWPIIFPKTTP